VVTTGPVRILVSVEHLGITGIAVVAIENAQALRERGHDVFLYAIPGPFSPRATAAGLTYLGRPDVSVRPNARSALRLRRAAAAHDADVVHAYSLRPGLEAFAGPHLLDGTPVVLSLLHNPTRTTPAYLPRTIPVVVGRESVVPHLRAQGVRTLFVVRPAVSAERPVMPVEVEAFRQANRLAPGERVVLVMARLDTVPELLAGIETTIAAVGSLAARDPSVRLVVLGDGSARYEVDGWAEAVNSRTGRETVVVMSRYLVDLAPAFAAADLVVAMATSALRSMVSGRPTLVTGPTGHVELPDAATMARYRASGVFADGSGAPDVGEIGRVIGALLDDPAAARALADLEAAEATDGWGAAGAAEALERVYAEVIAANRANRRDVVTDAVASAGRYAAARAGSATRRVKQAARSGA